MPKMVVELGALQVKRLGHGSVKKTGGKKKVGEPCTALHAVGGVSGLYLFCRPPGEAQAVGARSWILRMVVGSKRIDLGLGGFPEVTLAQARDKARDIKDKVRFEGFDPIAAKRAAKSALIAEQAKQRTFADVAQQYYKKKCVEFSGVQAKKQARRLEQYLFEYSGPIIGEVLMADLDTSHVLQVVEPIWVIKNPTADRIRATIETVCESVRREGILKNGLNPASWEYNLSNYLPNPETIHVEEHQPTVGYMRLPRFWELLQARDTIPARALEFQILTAARPGEVRFAEWKEIDLQKKLWIVPGWKIKGRKDKKNDHRVPLTARAAEILRSMPRNGEYVFPGYRGNPYMSENALNLTVKTIHELDVENGGLGFIDPMYDRVGTAHGMRSAFKDCASEVFKSEEEASELALSHLNTSSTRAAYKREQLLPKRRSLMNRFEKFLFGKKRPATK